MFLTGNDTGALPGADEARLSSEKTRRSATGWSNATMFLTGNDTGALPVAEEAKANSEKNRESI